MHLHATANKHHFQPATAAENCQYEKQITDGEVEKGKENMHVGEDEGFDVVVTTVQ